MEEEIKNHKNFCMYLFLVCNRFAFVLRLLAQTKCSFFGNVIYLLIEEEDYPSNGYKGKYIHTYTDQDCAELIGKRVYFMFKGVKEEEKYK